MPGSGGFGGSGGATAVACLPSFTDTFTAGMSSGYWGPSPVSPCASASIVKDALVEQIAGECQDTAALALDTSRFEVCGDFDFQVQYTLNSFPDPTYMERWAGVRIQGLGPVGPAGIDPNGMSIERFASASLMPFGAYRSFTSDSTASTLYSTADTAGALRITRVGDVMTAYYYNPNGATPWAMVRTDMVSTEPMTISLYSGMTEAAGQTISFDNVSFTVMSAASALFSPAPALSLPFLQE